MAKNASDSPSTQGFWTRTRTIVGVLASLATITSVVITILALNRGSGVAFPPGSCGKSTGTIVSPLVYGSSSPVYNGSVELNLNKQYEFVVSAQGPNGAAIPDSDIQWYTGFPTRELMGIGPRISFTYDNSIVNSQVISNAAGNAVQGYISVECSEPNISANHQGVNKTLEYLQVYILLH